MKKTLLLFFIMFCSIITFGQLSTNNGWQKPDKIFFHQFTGSRADYVQTLIDLNIDSANVGTYFVTDGSAVVNGMSLLTNFFAFRRISMDYALEVKTETDFNDQFTNSKDSLEPLWATNKPYTNTVTISSSGNAVFYLTSDKTSTGTALYSSSNIFPTIIINDSSKNYTTGWTLSGDFKTLTVNIKYSPTVTIGSDSVLVIPINASNGTPIKISIPK